MNDQTNRRRSRGDPSFSSTLLDSIYRSIDKPVKPEHKTGSKPAMIEKQSTGPRFLKSVSLETESKPVRSENRDRSDRKIAKPKQPISPGRRISKFLNSIFNSKRRSKLCSVGAVEDVSLSKTQTSSKTSSGGATRTVRFYEYGGSCGAESVVRRGVEIKKQSSNSEAAREFCKWSYGQKVKYGVECDGEDDDVESCASSDLFELDHLDGESGRYREELPVYETTRLRIVKNI